MHGGLSPELKSLEQIKRIPRPTDVPDTGLLCDLLWADPDKDVQARVCAAANHGCHVILAQKLTARLEVCRAGERMIAA